MSESCCHFRRNAHWWNSISPVRSLTGCFHTVESVVSQVSKSNHHPSDEDLSLGTPNPHPSDEDLSLGTPNPGAPSIDTASSGPGLRVLSQKFLPEIRRYKSRFFAHHPRTEKRSGPRSLRMTVAILSGSFGTRKDSGNFVRKFWDSEGQRQFCQEFLGQNTSWPSPVNPRNSRCGDEC
jgi:hypothetical protein